MVLTPRGGTRDFKWQGWSNNFLGFEIFNSGIFLGTKIWQVFFLGSLIWVGIFWGYKKESVVPWLCSLANKVQTNVFCCCLIVNYGVALHRTCYTIVCIVPWCPAVYKTSTASIQSIGFTVTGIPFCFSELLLLKMTARWGKGYIQMVWWVNKHECSISNVFICVIELPLSGTLKGRKIGTGFFGG